MERERKRECKRCERKCNNGERCQAANTDKGIKTGKRPI